jgi:hypothetical protein
MQMLLMIFSGVGLYAAVGMLQDIRAAKQRKANLIKAHLGAVIGSGIGAYTAFFAFGGARFLGEVLTGQWQIVPWVLPTLIGFAAIRLWSRQYRGDGRDQTRA